MGREGECPLECTVVCVPISRQELHYTSKESPHWAVALQDKQALAWSAYTHIGRRLPTIPQWIAMQPQIEAQLSTLDVPNARSTIPELR